MLSLILFLSGITLSAITFLMLRKTLEVDIALRANYRDNKITCLGGIYFLIPFIFISLIVIIINNLDSSTEGINYSVVIIALGFALLGLVDDLVGDKNEQGFKGHLLSLVKGRLTTGSLKLFGGPLVCLIALYPSISSLGYLIILCDVVAISLIANLVNLFDLAPGRSLKISTLILIVCLIVSTNYEWQFGVLGILLVLLYLDLKEFMMLGDVGSNLIGALIGYSIVNIATINQTYIVIAVAFVLNLLSEFISFSKIINKVMPLRILDTFGQTKERRTWLKNKIS